MKKRLPLTLLALGASLLAFAEEADEKVPKGFLSEKERFYIVSVLGLVLLAIFLWVLSKGNWKILRDAGTGIGDAPFSLSRTQMAWWTFVVLSSLLYVWWKGGGMIEMSNQLLLLMGISAGTTVTANFIDNKDIADDKIAKRHQSSASSKNIIMNIISDQDGPSIHRFQNVIFSLAIGVYVLFEVINSHKIPVLDENLMVLMGVSSSAYLAIKNGENKTYNAEVEKGELPPPTS